MKLLVIAVATIVITAAVIYRSDHTPTPLEPPPVTNPIKVAPQNIYDPESVTSLMWQYKDEKILLTKSDALSKDARWALERRVILLSKSRLIPVKKITDPLGEISIKTKTEDISGSYDAQVFRWDTGRGAGQGIRFEQEPNIREIFAEGLWGFKPHQITLCDPKKITTVNSTDWSLEKKQNGIWVLSGKDEVRSNSLPALFEKLCRVEVDVFDLFTKIEKATTAANIKWGNKNLELKRDGDFFLTGDFPSFKSETLSALLSKNTLADLRDPTGEIAKIAVDRTQSQEERIKSIRALRGNSSPEALNALRTIIFENTDIDLYRYEAVDTLAATNTKASFKIITDRLAQVGRSGFELRMARALAAAMGRFFKSDEKTPESERRPEVDELLKAAQTHPPGKDLAIEKPQ